MEARMESSIVAIFKEVARDYTIHIGRKITWVKNESYRVREKY